MTRPQATRVERWEERLKAVFDKIDAELEAIPYIRRKYSPHPNRPPLGSTSNPEDDGLFDIGASFTAGIGSEFGPGYVLSARVATLADVPPEEQEELENYVVSRLRAELPAAFPGAALRVDRDGPVWKIHGDLSLGSL